MRAPASVVEHMAPDRELIETQEQHLATSAILRIISSSPTDPRPVFGRESGDVAPADADRPGVGSEVA